ncbi:hypothetical protein K7432_007467 [Basidiobolus ranarum]|uniref:Cyclin N-terminal domain-containing protein n=1 Tax=Basidiobolus ranarum TaxID=34480 RepID=A0ABR2W008_9FUNG
MLAQPQIYRSALDHHQFQYPQIPRKQPPSLPKRTHPSTSVLYYDLSNQLRRHLIDITTAIVNTLYKCDTNLDPTSTPLREFISELIRHSKVPTNNILCALLYLVRMKRRHPECQGTFGAGYRLFLAALIISNKYLYDNPYQNQSWVKISGNRFTLQEINLMEFELLYFLNFHLNVTKEQWTNFVELIDIKVTENWSKLEYNVPRKFLYSKAISGIDDALGKSSRLPFLMKMNQFREESAPTLNHLHPSYPYTAFMQSPESPGVPSPVDSQHSMESANSIYSNDSGPKTPDHYH